MVSGVKSVFGLDIGKHNWLIMTLELLQIPRSGFPSLLPTLNDEKGKIFCLAGVYILRWYSTVSIRVKIGIFIFLHKITKLFYSKTISVCEITGM